MSDHNGTSDSIMTVFLIGAKKGIQLWLNNILPAAIMAFTLIRILELTGLLDVMGRLFGPVMAIFGLPGEAISVLATGWMSSAGGCVAAVSLAATGTLDGNQVAIILPMIFLMGNQAQYIGRVLGTAGATPRRYGVICAISIINAAIAGFVMRLLV